MSRTTRAAGASTALPLGGGAGAVAPDDHLVRATRRPRGKATRV